MYLSVLLAVTVPVFLVLVAREAGDITDAALAPACLLPSQGTKGGVA